jgi:hypothetical protein
MPKQKISEFSSTPANNTDIDSINISEGCAPSGINDAIRELMSQLKDFQTGAVGDSFNGPVGTTTAAAGAFTTLSATGNVTLGDASTDTLNVGNGGLIKDASGNLGLGVTPNSGWSSTYSRAMQLSTQGAYIAGNTTGYSGGTYAWFGNNGYLDSAAAFRYTISSSACQYQQVGGTHAWYTAPSGTAGNAISFTQAMTLDASGNLGVGTTSMSYPLTRNGITLKAKGADGVEFVMQSSADTGQDGFVIVRSGANAGLNNRTNGNLEFATNNTERARIDSSGNLLVGTTSNLAVTPRVAIVSSNFGLAINTTNGGSNEAVRFYNASTAVGTITTTGSATAYNTSSDQRLKENIQNADSASSLIDALQVRKFDWKSDNSHQRYGFVAQELLTVYPEAVHQPDDAEEMMAVDYSKLVPLLVKEIQSLKARLDAANL